MCNASVSVQMRARLRPCPFVLRSYTLPYTVARVDARRRQSTPAAQHLCYSPRADGVDRNRNRVSSAARNGTSLGGLRVERATHSAHVGKTIGRKFPVQMDMRGNVQEADRPSWCVQGPPEDFPKWGCQNGALGPHPALALRWSRRYHRLGRRRTPAKAWFMMAATTLPLLGETHYEPWREVVGTRARHTVEQCKQTLTPSHTHRGSGLGEGTTAGGRR